MRSSIRGRRAQSIVGPLIVGLLGMLGASAVPGNSAAQGWQVPERLQAIQRAPQGAYLVQPDGQQLVARGANYIRLTEVTWPGGVIGSYHSTFEPGRYTPSEAERVLLLL